MTHKFHICILVLALIAGKAVAEDLETTITRQLQAQGYAQVEVTRTWLGRARFQAQGEAGTREIVVNPRTGEILRDVTRSRSGAAAAPQLLERPAGSRGVPGAGGGQARPNAPTAQGRAGPPDPGVGADRPGPNGAGVAGGPSGPAGPGGGPAGPGGGPGGPAGPSGPGGPSQ